ncbi:MAG: ATP-binding cassette domain-containing protein, partial [Bdellovibrio sp.]
MTLIDLKNVVIEYDLYHDRSNTFKEFIINLFHGRSYVKERKNKHQALNGINLQVAEGERLGVIGSNGAGKSTLLKVIAGILKPQKGSVTV